jgi:hypothetical protein
MSRNIELRHLRYFVAMAWPIGFTIKRAPSDESKKARRSGGQEFQGGSAPQPERHDTLFRFGGRRQDRKTTVISITGAIEAAA